MEILTQPNVKYYDNYIDFGSIKLNSKALTTLTFVGNMSDFQIKAGCMCTTTQPIKIDDNTIKVDVEYKNTHIKGEFEKTLVVSYKLQNKKHYMNLKIKGYVS